MIFFMKKQKRDEEDIKEIKDAVEGKFATEKPKNPKRKEPEIFEEPVEEYEPIKLERRPERLPIPTAGGNVPLFVKIEKYKNVLSVLNEMKTTVMMLKNALALQQELERASEENTALIQSAISKIEKKILAMDAEFLRPSGYKEELPEQVYEAESLDYAVDSLKSQIDDLKSELEEV